MRAVRVAVLVSFVLRVSVERDIPLVPMRNRVLTVTGNLERRLIHHAGACMNLDLGLVADFLVLVEEKHYGWAAG